MWLKYHLPFFYPDVVTWSGSASPVSTVRGLFIMKREGWMPSLTTLKPKRLSRLILVGATVLSGTTWTSNEDYRIKRRLFLTSYPEGKHFSQCWGLGWGWSAELEAVSTMSKDVHYRLDDALKTSRKILRAHRHRRRMLAHRHQTGIICIGLISYLLMCPVSAHKT